MLEKTKYWYLSQFNLARRLKRKEFMYLSDSSLMKSYDRSNVIKHQHENDRHIYFLKKGTLNLAKYNEDREKMMAYLLPKGSIFGLDSLLNVDYQYNETVTAFEESVICKIDIQLFKELMDRNPELNNYILKLTGLRIRKLENRLEDIILKSTKERIREFIKTFSVKYGKSISKYFETNLFLNNKEIVHLTNTNRQRLIRS